MMRLQAVWQWATALRQRAAPSSQGGARREKHWARTGNDTDTARTQHMKGSVSPPQIHSSTLVHEQSSNINLDLAYIHIRQKENESAANFGPPREMQNERALSKGVLKLWVTAPLGPAG
eukprot:4198521-Amphidinium_carterae.1